MSNKMMWAYLIHLSMHMWEDETSKGRGLYVPKTYRETNDVDLRVWDSTVKYLGEHKYNTLLIDVGDAVKYERHPEISAPDAWDKDFFKKKLDEIRALGMTPIPKLNFSTCHDTWLKKYRRMVSTPEYYQVCADTIDEVAELFGNPELFHIGFDEEIFGHQRDYEMAIIRGEQLWWHDLNYIASLCEKNGARPWIWSDYYWHHKDLFIKNMSKEILQSNWFYDPIKEYTEADYERNFEFRAVAAYSELDALGFDQVPTSSTWTYSWNTYQTLALGKEKLDPARLKGFMTAPWFKTIELHEHRLLDDAYKLYHARCAHYPETL